MQITVQLTRQELKALRKALSRPYNSMLNFTRFLALFCALAPPLYTLVSWQGYAAQGEILRSIYSYPLLYAGLVFLLLLSPPVLRAIGFTAAERVNGPALTEQPVQYYISDAGLACYRDGVRVLSFNFQAASEITRHKNILLVLQGDTVLAALPTRCFATPTEAGHTEGMLRNGLVYSRSGYAQPLAITPERVRWRFESMVDGGTAASATALIQNNMPGGVGRRFTLWLVTLALLVVSFGLVMALSHSVAPASLVLVCILWAFVLLVLWQRNPHKLLASCTLPGYRAGGIALEIGDAGLRVYSAQCEQRYRYNELENILAGQGFAVILQNDHHPAAVLPLSSGPFEVVSAALDFVKARLGSPAVAPQTQAGVAGGPESNGGSYTTRL